MKKITEQNFDNEYIDGIEQERIDKFVADELDRQIHRYIKAMCGSKRIMDEFIGNLKQLKQADKEKAIAQYIDFHHRVIDGLDFRLVLTRAYANYCDTFDYFKVLLADENKFHYYLNRISDKYLQFHKVFEENGKFGLRNKKGEVLVEPEYDFLRRVYCYVDDLALIPLIAEKDGHFGLILPDGKNTVVADFIYDDISLREEYPHFEATKENQTCFIDHHGKVFPGQPSSCDI
jgi:hypothetical protein